MAPLLQTKGDAINIAGHKIPIALIGGVAAVIGVILVIRARQSGAGASVGPVPGNTGVNPVVNYGASGFGPDYSAALANITQELNSLGQGINTPTTTPAAAAGPSAVVASLGTPGFRFGPTPASGKFVWELTPTGQQQFQQVYGSPWSAGPQPSTSPVPSGLGAFSWEWAPIQ